MNFYNWISILIMPLAGMAGTIGFFYIVYIKKSSSDTRETGFINVITATGVTYAITRACTAGSLLECSCEKAIKSNMRIECKCHGLSGSCTLRTCWWRMLAFREVSNRLRDKFEGAAKVISNNDSDNFMPESTNIKQPGKKDIIYSEQLPDFCSVNIKTASLGTKGRQCNVSSAGTDGCDQLCCRRGFTQSTIHEAENCNCHFKWCCEVICETCYVKREIQTCL